MVQVKENITWKSYKGVDQGFFQTDCFIWLWEHFEKTNCMHQDLLSTLVTSKQPCKLFLKCLLEDRYAIKAQHCIRMFVW